MKFCFLLFTFYLLASLHIQAQTYDKNVLKESRTKMYQNLVSRSINDNLAKPLNEDTEVGWETALETMLFLQYHSPYTDAKIAEAVKLFDSSSTELNRALIMVLNSFDDHKYTQKIAEHLSQIKDDYLFAMTISYIRHTDTAHIYELLIGKSLANRNPVNTDANRRSLLFTDLYRDVQQLPNLIAFFNKDYLKGETLVLSFQRKDRDYPGLVIVRDSLGNFLTDSKGNFETIPQLARSLSNMPYYFFNGNTPQGIYRMVGFDTSRASFIGRTTNLQLKMPYETRPEAFYTDSLFFDVEWDVARYKNLLPESFREYYPLYQSYVAGKLGRTEIIAHGTTVNPDYYKGTPYYPLTPTQGCLTTKEIWNEETGMLEDSDQQRFTSLIKKAGGAHGYLIVIELDDKKTPVSLSDLQPALPSTQK